jgi:hypothetical protein
MNPKSPFLFWTRAKSALYLVETLTQLVGLQPSTAHRHRSGWSLEVLHCNSIRSALPPYVPPLAMSPSLAEEAQTHAYLLHIWDPFETLTRCSPDPFARDENVESPRQCEGRHRTFATFSTHVLRRYPLRLRWPAVQYRRLFQDDQFQHRFPKGQ